MDGKLSKAGRVDKIIATWLLMAIFMGALGGCSVTASARVNKKLDLAVKYLSEHEYEEAILAYQEAIKIDSKNLIAYKGLSLAYALQDKREQAKDAINEGLQQLPGNISLQLNMAALLYEQGRKDEAEDIYQDLLEGKLEGEKDKYLVLMAYTHMLHSEKRDADALTILEKAAETSTHDYQLLALLAEYYFYNNQSDKAREAIQRSLAIERNQSASYRLLAKMDRYRPERLVELGNEYLENGDSHAGQVIVLLGLQEQGKFKEVLSRYQEASTELKKQPELLILVAQAYIMEDKPDMALSLLKDINTDKLQDAGILAQLAGIYLDLENYEKAREIAWQGIAKDASLAENYAIVYQSYLYKEADLAEMWKTKYLLHTVLGVDQAIKELKNHGGMDSAELVSRISFSEESIKLHEKGLSQSCEESGESIKPYNLAWRNEAYLDTRNNTAYFAVFFNGMKLMIETREGWMVVGVPPSQKRKQVLIKVHNPRFYISGGKKAIAMKDYTQPQDWPFESEIDDSAHLNYIKIIAQGPIPFEYHLKKAGVEPGEFVIVDVPQETRSYKQ